MKTRIKLYIKRDSQGRFEDILEYKRQHAKDIKRKSKNER